MKCPNCGRIIYNMLDQPGWFWCPHCTQKHEHGVVPARDRSWKLMSDSDKNDFIASEILRYRVNRITDTWHAPWNDQVEPKEDFCGDKNKAHYLVWYKCGSLHDRRYKLQEDFIHELMKIILPGREFETTTGPTFFAGNWVRGIRTDEIFSLMTAQASDLMLALLRMNGVDVRD